MIQEAKWAILVVEKRELRDVLMSLLVKERKYKGNWINIRLVINLIYWIRITLVEQETKLKLKWNSRWDYWKGKGL